ncbi:MAG: efflux RND transporter periplasmic adaptor subunit [Bacteroidaceae bacterium]|nr:efflux RND transporter periplasmic adaptor subunit [Bacteroidaceae bacterium]
MKKFSYFISIFLMAAAMMSCGHKDASQEDAPIVDVVTVKGVGEVDATTFTGRTKSASEVNLAFRVAGQIERVLVNEGDYVQKGQVVAVMDARDYQVQVAATQAEYEQVKADAERVMALYAEGNTTASNNDKARYGLQQITQKLANHRNQLADTRLRSTISGYVQTKFHESGETVSAGMPVVSVFGSGDTEVEINISASDFAHIDKFTSFGCRFDVTRDETFPLTIARVSQEANTSQLYTVRLKFTGDVDHKKITPGMTTMVYAEVSGNDAAGVVSVPASAVLNINGKTQVYVYDPKSGVVKSRTVMVTRVQRDGTMQIDGGLKSGETIVASGIHHVRDGQKVKILEKPASSNVGGLL